MPLTRLTLLTKLQNPSDSKSWEEFVSIYEPVILATARRCGVRAEDLDDIKQDVLLQMLQIAPHFRKDASRGRFRSYLAQITVNKVRDCWRRRTRCESTLFDPSLVAIETPCDSIWDEELNRRLLQLAAKRVRETTRPLTWACFEKHVLLQQAAAVVAREHELTENAVFVNCSRTLARIRTIARKLQEDAEHVEFCLSE